MKKNTKRPPFKKKETVMKTSRTTVQEPGGAGIKKQYIKSGLLCRVSFRLPKEAAQDAKKVTIVGDFNDWNTEATPMKKVKNGDFNVTLELNAGRAYCFRYLIDGTRWENDWCADRYEQNPYGGENSIVDV